jgi:hypothetical protein
MTTTGRNDPCPCGSGKKFKACCLRKAGPKMIARTPSKAAIAQATRRRPLPSVYDGIPHAFPGPRPDVEITESASAPGGGTFTLSFNGQKSRPLPFNSSKDEIAAEVSKIVESRGTITVDLFDGTAANAEASHGQH